ncbi:UNVERIFIED_CONTAM: Imidazoleglycerol-phosphate dehydratase, chloroplastic [Sesamum radiatum]|uniref:Imidazoleglycerol-phosphate dehydratase, chloroplastic n=1 Tax=Sesamum radiatum TaxID=300843 RepID=A0AAW2QHU9_SESRA
MGLPVSPSSFTDSVSANLRMSNSAIPPMDSPSALALVVDGCSGGRIGEAERVRRETSVSVKINLDGHAVAENNTRIAFLNFLLDLLASHGSFDVHVKATGDSDRDDYHTTEDVGTAIGMALKQALGDRIGINQLGCFSAALRDALVLVSLDLSGRPHLSYDLRIPRETVGTYDPQLVEHFFLSLVNTFGMTLHIRQFAGRDSDDILEATFKAFARALRQATEYDARRHDSVPRFSFGSLVQNFKSSYGHPKSVKW